MRNNHYLCNLSRKLILLAIVFLGLSLFCLTADNPGHKLMRIYTDNPNIVRNLAAQEFDIAGVNRHDHWTDIIGTDQDEKRLRDLGYAYEIIDYSHPLGIGALSDYMDPVEISNEMTLIQTNYPSIAKKILVTGPLYEGQNQYAMKISDNVNTHEDEPVFILDCQHHANEVMTQEIGMDMMEYLTSHYASDPQVQNWINNIEIYIIPSINPDGSWYVFNADNYWRKNRHNGTCPVYYTDPNRNYDFNWNGCGGSSGTCSSTTYRGSGPESEMETIGLNDFVHSIYPIFSLSYHSSGELIMWSYGCGASDEAAAFFELGSALNGMLENDSGQTGQYGIGDVYSTIYPADGSSVDDIYGETGAAAFIIEVNTSQQPDYATWRNITVQRQRVAWQFMLDHTLDTPSIQGHVTDCSTGAPLDSDVDLQEVVFTHGEWQRQSYAADFGRYFRLAQSNHTYHISFSKTGYITQNRTVDVGTGTYLLDICLPLLTPSWAQYVADSAQIVGNPTGGDNDAYPDNCETATAQVTIESVGTSTALNVQVTITAASPFVTVTTPMPINLGNIPYQGTANTSFTYTVGMGANKAACMQAGNFNITVTSQGQNPPDQNSFGFTHEIDEITGNKTWAFETDLEGWTVPQGTWALSSARYNPGGSTHSLHSSEYLDGHCDVALSPEFQPTATTQLTIPNWYSTEPMGGSWYDRANVRVIQGASRTYISPTSGKLYKTGSYYNWSNCLMYTNPGWCGNATADRTWGNSVFSLSSFAGQNIQLEIAYLTDPNTNDEGVYVDDISATSIKYSSCDLQTDTCASAGPPGRVLNDMTINKSGSNYQLTWTAVAGSCTVTCYDIYRGTLPLPPYNHNQIACCVASTTYTDATASGSHYYLVVPENTDNEGSYGRDSSGTERPQGSTPCNSQDLTVCN